MRMLNQKGISVLESLCGIFLLLLVLLAASSQFAVFSDWGNGMQCRVEAQATARYCTDNIVKDAKNSCKAVISDGGKRLVLHRPNGTTVEYYSDLGGVLRRQPNTGGGAQPMSGLGIAPSRIEFACAKDANGLLKLRLKVFSWDKKNKRYSSSLETSLWLGDR